MPRHLIWLSLGAFAIGTEGFMIAGLLPLMASDLHVSLALAGQLVTVFAIAYAVGSPVLAVVTSSLERKVVLFGAILVFALANVLAASANTYFRLMAARVLLGLGAGTFMPTAGSYAAMSVAPALRGRALAVVLSGHNAAILLGVPLGTLVGRHYSWRATFVGVAIASAIAMAGMLARLPGVATPPSPGLAARLKFAGRREILSVLVLTLSTFAGGFVIIPYLAPLMAKIAGFQGDTIALLLFIFGAGGVAGSFLGGQAADKWNKLRFLSILLVLVGAIFAVFSLCGELRLPLAVVRPAVLAAVLLWGPVGSAFNTVQQARLVALAGPFASIALSLNSSALYFGIGLGAVLGSFVITSASVTLLGWTGAACEVFALIWLVARFGEVKQPGPEVLRASAAD